MKHILVPLALASLTACSSLYYSTMEKFGYQKRDLLVDRVQEASASQVDAKQQIQTTLEAFQSLTGFQGGELEARYKQFKGLYEQSASRGAEVTKRIASIEEVGGDMFTEWEKEIDEIQNADLRARSTKMKADTEQRYAGLIGVMKVAEQRMKPVLTAFNDQVLFLKHNLNASAIGAIDKELVALRTDVDALVVDLESSIAEAETFIAQMDAEARSATG